MTAHHITPRRDTRGLLRRPAKKACCASCADGKPCDGGAPLPPPAPAAPCCASCAGGGGCEGDAGPRLAPAVYQGHVAHARGAELWVVRSSSGSTTVRGGIDAFLPGDDVLASVVAPDLAAARRLLASRTLGDLGRRPRVGRDTRGLLAKPAAYQAFFWGPSSAEEAAFQELYKRYNQLLDHTGIVAQMRLSSPTLSQMLDAWFSFAKLWLAGDEEPDQLSPRAKDLAILENTARDLYGYDKPKGDVVVPLPQDSPILGTVDDLGQVLEDAGVPMADPHGGDALRDILATVKTIGALMVVGGGLYVAAPLVAAVVRGRRRAA